MEPETERTSLDAVFSWKTKGLIRRNSGDLLLPEGPAGFVLPVIRGPKGDDEPPGNWRYSTLSRVGERDMCRQTARIEATCVN